MRLRASESDKVMIICFESLSKEYLGDDGKDYTQCGII